MVWIVPGGLSPQVGADVPCLVAELGALGALGERVSATGITWREPGGRRVHNLGRARVIALGTPGRVSSGVSVVRTLDQLDQQRHIDVVHAFMDVPMGVVTASWARSRGRTSIFSMTGGEVADEPALAYGQWRTLRGRLAMRTLCALATIVTAPSDYLTDLARARGLRRTIDRLPFAIDQAPFRAVLGREPIEPVLLCVCDHGPIKDIPTVLRALKRLPEPIRLRIAGTERGGAAIVDAIREIGVESRVELLGRVPHDELPEIYGDATLLVHASRHEGQGVVFVEAAAAGVPIVSTPVGLAPEMAARDAAIVVPKGDDVAMADAISRLLDDRPARHAQARRARAFIESFDLEPTVDRLCELYSA